MVALAPDDPTGARLDEVVHAGFLRFCTLDDWRRWVSSPPVLVPRSEKTAVSGEAVSQIIEGNYTVGVVVRYPAEMVSSPAQIGAITVPGSGG